MADSIKTLIVRLVWDDDLRKAMNDATPETRREVVKHKAGIDFSDIPKECQPVVEALLDQRADAVADYLFNQQNSACGDVDKLVADIESLLGKYRPVQARKLAAKKKG